MSPRPLSLSTLRTVPLSKRKKDCDKHDFAAPYRGGGLLSAFLCSLSNLGESVERLTTAVIDSSASSHTVEDVVERLTQQGGKGFWLRGADEILIPLLFASVVDVLGE
jgi:hypothetical protein